MRTLHLLSASALTIAVLAAPMVLTPTQPAQAQFGVGVSITIAPPALPVYVQPPLPAPGYLWTPGYWNYGDAGYFWVPGTWVEPPSVGLLWTPGYWGFNNGIYAFNAGYWGPHVGFYGGINYGFGYGGFGFEGGEWRGGGFFYNSSVNNFGGTHITNVYNRTVVNRTVNNVSFNGPNGVNVRPRAEEVAYAREQHVQPTAAQQNHQRLAAANPELRSSVNHGNPAIAATARPAEFKGAGVVPARPVGTPLARPAEAGKTSEPTRTNTAAERAGGARPAMREPSSPAHPNGPAHTPVRTAGAPRPAGMAPHAGGVNRTPGIAGPRPMGGPGPRPMGGPGPRPMGMGGPRPGPMGGAPHAAPAPHGGGGEHGPHH